jgi:hypothetical protein
MTATTARWRQSHAAAGRDRSRPVREYVGALDTGMAVGLIHINAMIAHDDPNRSVVWDAVDRGLVVARSLS